MKIQGSGVLINGLMRDGIKSTPEYISFFRSLGVFSIIAIDRNEEWISKGGC